VSAGDDLRRAVAALTPRERAALAHHAEQAAGRWAEHLPRLGAVWHAFAALVLDVDQAARARAAADLPAHHMRPARRQRL
jgi:hypothetical protein